MTSVALCWVVVGLPVRLALAVEPATDAEVADSETEAGVDEAQRLFREGASHYETADYQGAIELWTRAYDLVPAVPEYGEAKADLIFNIATAHERAYDVDHDLKQLNQAKILLERYRTLLPDIYESPPELEYERTRVDETITAIQRKIDQAESDARRQHMSGTVREEKRAANNLVISGAVVTALGAVGLGLGTAGMAIGAGANDLDELEPDDLEARRDQFDRGRTGNTLAIAGGVTAGVLVPVGVALLTVGVLRKKKLERELADGGRRRPTLAPSFGSNGGGVVLTGRF